MKRPAALAAVLLVQAATAQQIREVVYDPMQVIHVSVSRGVPTHVQFEPGEVLVLDPATGLDSNCTPESAWCIAAEKGGSDLMVKPTSASSMANAVAVKTNRRSYSFSFDPVPSPARAVTRLIVRPPPEPQPDAAAQRLAAAAALAPQPAEVLERRMSACPRVLNSSYSVATGRGSGDIVPRAVFDDGRFTYMQFPGNAPLPVPFEVQPDGSEAATTPTTVCGFWSVDRVVRRLRLRHGSAVVELTNEAFNLEGRAPVAGSGIDGVERLVRDPRTGQFKQASPQ
ncbi:TrbG/VirB9 family P-type conjugative transfer protein [Azohydromonas australica]|uniref:TrbG/VirB9 family P-type conjugative transfer protein n=1 Tax=Azohydromonas australica TaxID=364039 RepID=UPI0003F9A174|nr:TrbG/VirB9 family P-type conjugative transfer protein [Azohydromonas australica]